MSRPLSQQQRERHSYMRTLAAARQRVENAEIRVSCADSPEGEETARRLLRKARARVLELEANPVGSPDTGWDHRKAVHGPSGVRPESFGRGGS